MKATYNVTSGEKMDLGVIKKPLLLIELNEVNFDRIKPYLSSGQLPNFSRIFTAGVGRTESEGEYELLEPWIQWVSAHTGLCAKEHKITRLGDIVNRQDLKQIFEVLEENGYRVGTVSVMNADNRLENSAYFIPDPWTDTPSDRSRFNRMLSAAVAQAVNDNASSRLTLQTVLTLAVGLLRYARLKNYFQYLRMALGARRRPWRKALFLDLFLHDIHAKLFRARQPDFSAAFFNAGAHIQHHYFFNAQGVRGKALKNPDWYLAEKQDPFGEMLAIYDRIIGDYLAWPDIGLIFATGLTQQPYDRIKYYWRIIEHERLMDLLEVPYHRVLPRMTRDFLIECNSVAEASETVRRLTAYKVEGTDTVLFGEIDNRGDSVFVTLTYPDAIDRELVITDGKIRVDLKPWLAFVAIKNGMHDGNGFFHFSGAAEAVRCPDGAHVKTLAECVMRYFGVVDGLGGASKPEPVSTKPAQ